MDAGERKRLVVVGGGINGLAAAWRAWETASEARVEVVLLEAAAEVGGKAKTRRADGWIFEEGPTGFLGAEGPIEKLVQRSGLTALRADAAAARRFVVRGGKAREIRMAPPQFAMSGILSLGGLLRIAKEPWIPAKQDDADESVWDFAARRLGPQAADRLVAPMVLGVYAGDAKRLSLPAAFPRMAELEREYGGLFKAFFALAQVKSEGAPKGGPGGPGGPLLSFADGLQSLPIALAERAPFEVRRGAPLRGLARDAERGRWMLSVEGADEALAADAVVLSCDVPASANLLDPLAPAAAAELSAISMPGLAVVGLGFSDPVATRRLPVGFGTLIPRGEGYRSLGVLFDTHLFPGRSPEGKLLARLMIGGATDPEAVSLSDGELLGIAIDDLKRLYGLKAAPESYEIARWPAAIPQYELGHLERVSRIERALNQLRAHAPGLHLAGCHAKGVAFAKSAAEGWRVGEVAANELMEKAAR